MGLVYYLHQRALLRLKFDSCQDTASVICPVAVSQPGRAKQPAPYIRPSPAPAAARSHPCPCTTATHTTTHGQFHKVFTIPSVDVPFPRSHLISLLMVPDPITTRGVHKDNGIFSGTAEESPISYVQSI